MLHNPKGSFHSARTYVTPAIEARRLRLEYNRLQRRLDALQTRTEPNRRRRAVVPVERVARELGHIRADSVHAVE